MSTPDIFIDLFQLRETIKDEKAECKLLHLQRVCHYFLSDNRLSYLAHSSVVLRIHELCEINNIIVARTYEIILLISIHENF